MSGTLAIYTELVRVALALTDYREGKSGSKASQLHKLLNLCQL